MKVYFYLKRKENGVSSYQNIEINLKEIVKAELIKTTSLTPEYMEGEEVEIDYKEIVKELLEEI